MTIKRLALAASTMIIAAPSAATVVTFGGLIDSNFSHLSAGGLNFDTYGPSYVGPSYAGGADNGTSAFQFDALVTITKQGGGSFFLDSIDFGQGRGGFGFFNWPITYQLFPADGDMVVGDFRVDGTFRTVTFGQEVTSMIIATDRNWVALDNVTYHDVPAPENIPEPAMLGLFGMGALALGLARRKTN